MGLESACIGRLNGAESSGKAYCGDGEVSFRGDFNFRWKWQDLSQVECSDGTLSLQKGADQAQLQLGASAEKWKQDILNPKSRLDKLGLKPEHRYRSIGEFDETFSQELVDRAAQPQTGQLDAIFVRLNELNDLAVLSEAKQEIVPNGMIWAVWPKGRKEFREDDIRNFALQNGLVDVKVASFSEKLSALKLVIPKANRS